MTRVIGSSNCSWTVDTSGLTAEMFDYPTQVDIFAPTKAEADAVVHVGFRELRASKEHEVRTHTLGSPRAMEGMRHRPGRDRVIVANTYSTVLSRPSPGMGYYEGLKVLLRNLAMAGYPLEDVELVFLELHWVRPVLDE